MAKADESLEQFSLHRISHSPLENFILVAITTNRLYVYA